jgi:hypothetical protein
VAARVRPVHRDDVDALRAILDDLGLVVEGIEFVGEGLEVVVVARIDEIARSRAPTGSAGSWSTPGDGAVEVVCGA